MENDQRFYRDKSDTPRTDRFVENLQPISLRNIPPDEYVRVAQQIREYMIAWATFARDLERELMNSTPKEWLETEQERRDRITRDGPDTIP